MEISLIKVANIICILLLLRMSAYAYTYVKVRASPKGPGKRGHITGHDVSWAGQTGKHLLRTRNVSEQNLKNFCVTDTKFVSSTNVARADKRGSICVGDNESTTMCSYLPEL